MCTLSCVLNSSSCAASIIAQPCQALPGTACKLHTWLGISPNETKFLESAAAVAGITVAAEDRFILNSAGPKRQELAREEREHLA